MPDYKFDLDMTNLTLEERIVRYWNNQPCNIKHGTSEVGSLKFFSGSH